MGHGATRARAIPCARVPVCERRKTLFSGGGRPQALPSVLAIAVLGSPSCCSSALRALLFSGARFREESRLREANRLEETETRDCEGAGQLRGGMPTHRTQPAERTQLTRGPSRLEGPASSEAPVSSEGPIDWARSLGFEQRIRPRKWSGTEETVARGHGGGVGGLDDRHSLEARLQSLSVLSPQDCNKRQTISRIVPAVNEGVDRALGDLFPPAPAMRARSTRSNRQHPVQKAHALTRPFPQITGGGAGRANIRLQFREDVLQGSQPLEQQRNLIPSRVPASDRGLDRR